MEKGLSGRRKEEEMLAGGHARDPERPRQLPHFLEVDESYESIPSKTLWPQDWRTESERERGYLALID
jgi:hypothetical protein